MGRFLDIARDTESTITLPRIQSTVHIDPPPLSKPKSPHADALPFDALASVVLIILAKAGRPVSHTKIVQAMIGQGNDKTSARQTIARCQKRRWIEHDLETGYVLCQSEPVDAKKYDTADNKNYFLKIASKRCKANNLC